ncbi:MAG: preprotein translocase subunit SecY [Parcubacteria group bacterium ADurb.Bin159]|nr:MAG: preprotein translocase subunit SecY [Parcubacteria group bacterium ADurb.Bin159]
MPETITRAFQIKSIRNRILFVVAMLCVFRFAAHIPLPGVDVNALKNFFADNQLLGMLNLLSGGAMSNFSIITLGLGPYITASIIIQLLTMIIPSLGELAQEGQRGQQKINQYTNFVTIPLAMLQSYGMIRLLQSGGTSLIGELKGLSLITAILTMTAGTMFLVWLGELITEKRIGNGVSLLILAGIVERLPISLQQSILTFTSSQIITYIVFILVAILTIVGVVYLTEGERNIPISYARRIRGNRMYGGTDTYLPLRVNPVGMIPIIFAMAIVLIPGFIGQFLSRAASPIIANFGQGLANLFQNQIIYGLVYFALVFAFTYFYTSIVFHPDQISENLQRSGGFIPGIRPGEPTTKYLHSTLQHILLFGALSLGIIAVLPIIVQGIFHITAFTVGGASVLIVVSVILETMEQIKSQIAVYEYEGK